MTNRIAELRKHLAPDARGVEIGAYHNPITPRGEGFRSVHLDIFDADEQRTRAEADPNLTAADVQRIEDVDLVGSANEIAALVIDKYGDEKFDYVVSSHNLEHLPNPIKFLQGCQQILRDGGHVSLALPDHRYCFDFFRARTEVGEWLEAFAEDRTQPSRSQLFQWVALASSTKGDTTWNPATTDPPEPWPMLDTALQYWDGSVQLEYLDAHCWIFTPSSFRLLIEDLRHLGFLQFDVESISPVNGCEFYVHLRYSPGAASGAADPTYAERRATTMRDMVLESAAVAGQFASTLDQPATITRFDVPATEEAKVQSPQGRRSRLRTFVAARRR